MLTRIFLKTESIPIKYPTEENRPSIWTLFLPSVSIFLGEIMLLWGSFLALKILEFIQSFLIELSASESISTSGINPLLCLTVSFKGVESPVGSLSLLQGIFPSQGSNVGFPHCCWILYQLSHKLIIPKSSDCIRNDHKTIWSHREDWAVCRLHIFRSRLNVKMVTSGDWLQWQRIRQKQYFC